MKKEIQSPQVGTVKATPRKSTAKFVDKQYKLTRETAPLSLILASRHTTRFPLLHFDEQTGLNKPLRYARNQNSPFQDEQDDNAILEPIVFEDGFLHVPKNNQVLQKFMALHPGNGRVFTEVNKAKEAAELVEDLNLEVDALINNGAKKPHLAAILAVSYTHLTLPTKA